MSPFAPIRHLAMELGKHDKGDTSSTFSSNSSSSSSRSSSSGNNNNNNNNNDNGNNNYYNNNKKPAIRDYEVHLLLTEIGDACAPIIIFSSEAVTSKGSASMKRLGEKFHLTFKLVNTECKIVKTLLSAYGFHEVHPSSPDFNVTWTNSHIKPGMLHCLTEFQKINHFPRSFELTRKDRLYRNIQQMQQSKGVKCFDFIPQSFLIPMEYAEFCNEFKKWKGLWIVKPLALSRGRGIYVISRPDDLSVDEPVLVAKYIDNPFLINGYKFDLRLYVAVTSFDPLVLYLYKEGLARFATEKYRKGIRHLGNQCMHLTNYSVNRHSANYVRCYDPNVEDYGNKWSLSALMSYLQRHGFNTTSLHTQIKDIIIKAIMSAEHPIATACKIEASNHGNCFELFGFDILLDDTMRPWLLEVNFSPSLACDLPLDLKIKSKVVADLLTLTGVIAHDPLLLRFQQKRASNGCSTRVKQQVSSERLPHVGKMPEQRHAQQVHSTELRIAKMVHEENERRGDFVRIFPTANTWELYGHFFEARQSYNEMLHKVLFPSIGKFTLVDVCKGSKAFYTCLKSKERGKHQSNKLELAKKFVSAAFGRFNSSSSDAAKSKHAVELAFHHHHHHQSAKMASSTESVGDEEDCNPMIRLLKMDETLSQVQSRQVFALYLRKVGHRLNTIMMEEPVQHSRQSCLHFKQQLELVLQFLNYASENLASPIRIQRPDASQAVCVQGKHLLTQIDRFMKAYENETERMCSAAGSDDREYFVEKDVFNKFIQTAKASELEEVLMIVTEHHSTSWFLGSRKDNYGHYYDSSRPHSFDHVNLESLGNFHQFFPQRSRSTHDCSRSSVGCSGCYSVSDRAFWVLSSTSAEDVADVRMMAQRLSVDHTTASTSLSSLCAASQLTHHSTTGQQLPKVKSNLYRSLGRMYSSKNTF